MNVLSHFQKGVFRKVTVTDISFNWILAGWSFKNQCFNCSIWSTIGSNDIANLELSWFHVGVVMIKDHRTIFDVSRKLLEPFWSEFQGSQIICFELGPKQSEDLGPMFVEDRNVHPLMNGLTYVQIERDNLRSMSRDQLVQ